MFRVNIMKKRRAIKEKVTLANQLVFGGAADLGEVKKKLWIDGNKIDLPAAPPKRLFNSRGFKALTEDDYLKAQKNKMTSHHATLKY